MKKTKSFKELIVWQRAHKLVLDVYKITRKFPREELYALTNQLKRASVSVAANIAEGYKKKTPAAKLNLYNVSEGSLEEIKYYFILAKDLEYITEEDELALTACSDEVGKLLNAYMTAIPT